MIFPNEPNKFFFFNGNPIMSRCKGKRKGPATDESAPKWSRIRQICEASRHKLGQLVPGDELGRTYADWIAAAVIQRAMHGDLKAIREIWQATEKSVVEKQGKRATDDLLAHLTLEDKINFLREWKRNKEVAGLKSDDLQSPSSRDGSVPDRRMQ